MHQHNLYDEEVYLRHLLAWVGLFFVESTWEKRVVTIVKLGGKCSVDIGMRNASEK